MMKVYGDIYSGNCYKIKLLMALLGIEHEWVAVEIIAGETHAEEFKAINPNSGIPVLEIDNEPFLCESNAIRNYPAEGSELLPQDRYARAQVLQRLFFEQEGGDKAVGIREQRLTDLDWLVGNNMTIADFTLYG